MLLLTKELRYISNYHLYSYNRKKALGIRSNALEKTRNHLKGGFY